MTVNVATSPEPTSVKPTYITLSTVKKRGWSDKLIKNVLGGPQKEVPNPRYRCAADMKLWDLAVVEQAETHQSFIAYRTQRENRSKAARKRGAEKRQRFEEQQNLLITEIASKPLPQVGVLPLEDVFRSAIQSWENYSGNGLDLEYDFERFGDRKGAGANLPEAVKIRIAVNHIRHEMTAYHAQLDTLNKMGAGLRAEWRFKKRFYQAIAEAYPTLTPECQRQFIRKKQEAYLRQDIYTYSR